MEKRLYHQSSREFLWAGGIAAPRISKGTSGGPVTVRTLLIAAERLHGIGPGSPTRRHVSGQHGGS